MIATLNRRIGTLDGQLLRFYLFRACLYFYLWLPVANLYKMQMRGLTLTEISVMGSVLWLASALAEVPSGVVADVWGRRRSLAIGAFLYTAGLLATAVAESLWALMGASLLQMTAFAFISGADMALLYDTLKEQGREGEFVKHQGRSLSVMYAAQGVSAVLGAWLGLYGLNLPYLATVPIGLMAWVFALGLREPEPTGRQAQERRTPWSTLTSTLALARSNPALRFALLYTAITYVGPFLLFYVFLQPYALAIGLPAGWIGVAMVGLRAISLAASARADAVLARVGEVRMLWLAPLAIAAAAVGMAVAPAVASLLMLGCIMFINALHRPVASAVLNRQVESQVRATVLSAANLLSVLMLAGIEPLMGVTADRLGVPAMLLVLGGGTAALSLLVLASWQPQAAG